MIVRPATPVDLGSITAIYGHACQHGFGTFEEVPPSAEEMGQRMAGVTARGLPYLVAEIDGKVAGLAYVGPFRLRAAYRYLVEDSVYVAPEFTGRGVGRAVLGEVIGACEAMGLRQIMAVIGDSGNEASIGLHRSLGFEMRGSIQSAGYKFGRWVDIVLMQKAINGGDTRDPDAPGLALRGF